MRKHVILFILAAAFLTASCGKTVAPTAFDESKVVLSLGVVSDVHINTALPVTSAKWESALNQLSAKAGENDPDVLDGVLVAGDLIDYPDEGFIAEFKRVYESVFDPAKTPLIYTVGNHDVPDYRWKETMVSDAEYIIKALGDNYFLTDVDKEALEGLECRHCVVGKYDVLSVTPVGTSPVTYSPEALEWLDGKLSEITSKHPSRYVIVITHPMLYDTVYGSLLGEADGIWKSYLPGYWATRELPEILSRYPQVVAFGGHLHFPLNDPRSVWQGDFTALGCGSVRYMALEAGRYEDMAGQTTMKDKDEFSQGNLVQFDSNGNMRVFRMDFYNDAVIGDPLFMPRPSKDKTHLEGYSFPRRQEANEAPSISTLDVAREVPPAYKRKGLPGWINVGFTSGSDDEFVHHYVVELSSGGDVIATKRILSDFYKYPSPSMMKSSWEVTIPLEDFPGKCVVSLTAFDSWDAASETLTKEIEIKK